MADDTIKRAQQLLQTIKDKKNDSQEQLEKDRRDLVSGVGQSIVDAISPILSRIANDSQTTKADFEQAIRNIKVDVNVPDVTVPPINVPEPRVTVQAPTVNVPQVKMPEEMNVKGWLGFMGYDRGLLSDPLPVQIRDANGKPIDLSGGVSGFFGGGGGAPRIVKVSNLDEISITAAAGLTDTQLRASSVPVAQASGAIWSTYLTGIANSSFTELQNGDGRLRVSVETGGSGLTDSELRATSVPVEQVSGSVWSTYVTGALNSLLVGYENPDGRIKVELPSGASGLTDTELRASSVPVAQASGASWSTSASQAGTWNIGTVTTVTSVTNSIAASLVDSTGVQYSGSNPVPISDAGGSVTVDGTVAATQSGTWTLGANSGVDIGDVDVTSVIPGTGASNLGKAEDAAHASGDVGVMALTVANESNTARAANNDYLPIASDTEGNVRIVGNRDHDAVDAGEVVKVGGVARTSNPTAVASGDRVQFHADKLGRQLVRPVQMRDLTSTAYATLTNGSETTLFAGATSTYHDLIYVLGANTSDVAVTVHLRASLAGNILMSLQIPASATAGVATPVPIPAGDVGATWTADMDDITGTTVYLSALFSKEL